MTRTFALLAILGAIALPSSAEAAPPRPPAAAAVHVDVGPVTLTLGRPAPPPEARRVWIPGHFEGRGPRRTYVPGRWQRC
jgi:hypothetical protein